MKTLIAAAGLLAIGATAASAQFAQHSPEVHPSPGLATAPANRT